MKTAEDFKKLIEGFSGDISADNALHAGFSNKKWLGSAHIYKHNAAKHF